MTEVSVRVRWEGAHRLPELPGKCQSLHGHSWQAWVTLDGPVSPRSGVVVDFSAAKNAIQRWVDDRLDHATMLGSADKLLPVFTGYNLRHYVFGEDPHTQGLLWPTVENVALLLYRVATYAAAGHGDAVQVVRVEVAETENNRAAAP